MTTPLDYEMKHQFCSNYELANYLGVSEKSVSRWRTGDTEPTAAHKKQIAQFLGVKVWTLWSNIWKIEDLEEQYESLKIRLACYHYKDPRFATLCSRLAAIGVKLYIRAVKRRKKEEGPDPYIIPTQMEPYLGY